MKGALELVANVLVMDEMFVYVLVMGVLVLVLVADRLLVGGALVVHVDVLIEHTVLADALHVCGNVLVVEAVVVCLQTLEVGEMVEEVCT